MDLPESNRDPEAELRDVMGEYWMTSDEISGALFRS
jgi:hypothetical protein